MYQQEVIQYNFIFKYCFYFSRTGKFPVATLLR
jgi:hypothetical protein